VRPRFAAKRGGVLICVGSVLKIRVIDGYCRYISLNDCVFIVRKQP